MNFFYQNIKAYPTFKKFCINEWLGKYFCLLGRILAKRGVGEQVWFVPNTAGGSGSTPILGKFCKIYSDLILEPVFAGLKLTKNCYVNMNVSFSGKESVLLKTGFTSLSYKHTVPERLSSQFHKIWINGDLKNPSVSNYLLNWENLETQTRLILKKQQQCFCLFHQWGRIGKSN